MRVLIISSEWPTSKNPEWVPFLVEQIESLKSLGVDFEIFSFRGKGNIFNYINAWFRLRKKLHSIEIDLIHAHWGQSALLAFPKTKPLVVTFHGSDLFGIVNENGKYKFNGKLLKILSNLAFKMADKVIIISKRQLNFIPTSEKVTIIPCGVNFDKFTLMEKEKARELLGLPKNKKIVLFASDPKRSEKRFDLAERAVKLLDSSFDVELVVINKIPHYQVPIYLNASDVLLVTSKHEGGPLIVKEALACNLPIVSVDVGDVRDYLGSFEGCYICEDNPIKLSEGLICVLNDEKKLYSRNHITNELAISKIAERIHKLYLSLL